MQHKKFTKGKDKKLAGVAAGIGEYVKIDPLLIRAGFILLTFLGGSGFILYIVLALLMSNNNTEPEPSEKQTVNIDDCQNTEKKSAQQSKSYQNEPKQTEDVHTVPESLQKSTNTNSLGRTIAGVLFIYFGMLLLLRQFILFRTEIYLACFLIFVGLMIIVAAFTGKKKEENPDTIH
jgi:phage shock protein PspC (stress-responsive transcriptional regulator)